METHFGPSEIPMDVVLQSTGKEYHAAFYPLTETFDWPYTNDLPHTGEILVLKKSSEKRVVTEVTVWNFPNAHARIKSEILCEIDAD